MAAQGSRVDAITSLKRLLRNETFIGYCNQPQGFSVLGLVYLAKYETLPCVVYSPVKGDEPHLERTDDYIEFDSRKGGRIRVVWHRT